MKFVDRIKEKERLKHAEGKSAKWKLHVSSFRMKNTTDIGTSENINICA